MAITNQIRAEATTTSPIITSQATTNRIRQWATKQPIRVMAINILADQMVTQLATKQALTISRVMASTWGSSSSSNMVLTMEIIRPMISNSMEMALHMATSSKAQAT